MSEQSFPESTPADETVEVVPESVTDVTPDAGPVAPDVAPPPPAAAVAQPAPSAPSAPAQWPTEAYPAAAAYPTQPGYPPAGYAPYPPPAQTSNNAVVALILSVVSWVVCPIIAAIVALVFANLAGKEIEASGGRVQGQGLVTASRWVAWINIGVFAAAIVLTIFISLFFAIVLGTSSNVG
jgi:hypothetical protein